jgi:hypothetical protein
MSIEPGAETTSPNTHRSSCRAHVLSRKAEELGQISAAARFEELIGKHCGMFVDCTALLSVWIRRTKLVLGK